MKTKVIFFAILLGTTPLLLLNSCKKYEEGPSISLRSKTERVANTWKIENYKINGTDFTSLVSEYTETFTKSGTYSYSWGLASGWGNWSFQNDKTEIKLNGSEAHTSRTLFIKKLEEKSFWYTFVDDNDTYEVHLIEN
jgi:hypothetical protein